MTFSARQRACLDAMGIDLWVLRDQPTGNGETVPPQAEAVSVEAVPPAEETAAPLSVPVTETQPPSAEPAPPAVESLDWAALEQAVRSCTRCELHASRQQAVFGVGDRKADWLIIGEAPGAEEDRQGEPFVGRAGQLLNAMLKAAGLGREQVYIANILKCRPPGNRDPKPEEAAACLPYLQRQIDLIRPRIILAVGGVAAQGLLQPRAPVARLRGRLHHIEATPAPVIVTYHPAYLLRSPAEKRKAWEDLQFAMQTAEAPAP
jgi:DNA polymerase